MASQAAILRPPSKQQIAHAIAVALQKIFVARARDDVQRGAKRLQVRPALAQEKIDRQQVRQVRKRADEKHTP